MDDQPKITLYYDGLCNLCSGLVSRIQSSSQSGTVRGVDVTAGTLPSGVTQEGAMRDVHVVDADGRLYKGVDAVLRVMEEYPHLSFPARVGHVPIVHTIAAAIYRFVARTRYWIFGRKHV